MSENRDTRAIFSASRCADEFTLIYRTTCHMFLQSSFQFGFLSSKPCLFFLESSLELACYTVENRNLLVCRLNSSPIDQSFTGSSVLRPEVSL